MFRLKICGITSVDDARAAADAGADAVGLNFFRKSRRFVEPDVAQRIVAALPSRVTKVGVFVNREVGEIVEVLQQVNLDFIQLHGDEPATILVQLPTTVRVVRAHRCGSDGLEALVRYMEDANTSGRLPDALLIDADTGADFGGTGQTADWPLIAK